MTLSLKDKEWKEFFLEDLFLIKSTSSSIDRNKLNTETGEKPYITRTDRNNGYDSFVTEQKIYNTDSSNVITIGLDTQTIFYQPHQFYTGQNIQILSSKELNKHLAFFIMPLIKIQMEKFSWGGNGATLSRLKRQRILLPVTPKGEPDYAFMEQYMQEQETALIEKYKVFITSRLEREREREMVKEWKEFQLGALLAIENCKCSKVSGLSEGDTPYVGATNRNNGVLSFLNNDDKFITKGNCIAFICDGEGSIGYSIYKKEDFIGSTTVKVGRNDFLNKHVGLFITTIADRARGRYNFGFKRNEKHLKAERLLLPVTLKGEPDYKYMEQYMKALELKKLKTYLDWKISL